MLTITEASTTYPPKGRIPSLEDEKPYNAVYDTIGKTVEWDVWVRLVNWSGDLTPRTYATWAEAAKEAARELRSEADEKEEAFKTPLGEVNRGLDEQLATNLNMVSPQVVRARKFANCGQTAVLVLSALDDLIPALKPLRKNPVSTTVTTANANSLNTVLHQLPPADQVTLIDCSFPAVHTFLIEAHSDGRRYLIQGYQGVYVASWWMGTEDAGLVLAPLNRTDEEWERKFEEAKQAVTDMRTCYGLGRAIGANDWNDFVNALVSAFGDGTWGTFAEHWLDLPFAPTTGEKESIGHRGGQPSLQITSYTVADPNPNQLTSLCAPLVPATVMAHMK